MLDPAETLTNADFVDLYDSQAADRPEQEGDQQG
jgi:hypothetical protein